MLYYILFSFNPGLVEVPRLSPLKLQQQIYKFHSIKISNNSLCGTNDEVNNINSFQLTWIGVMNSYQMLPCS